MLFYRRDLLDLRADLGRLREVLLFTLTLRTRLALRLTLLDFLPTLLVDLLLLRDFDFLAFLRLLGLEAFLFLEEALRLRLLVFLEALRPRRLFAEPFLALPLMRSLKSAPFLTSAPLFTALAMATLTATDETLMLCAAKNLMMDV